MSNIEVGNIVRVKEPDGYLAAFANKIRDRNAVVEWIGPDQHGQFKGMAWIRFLKRNGRGKEFRERMEVRSLEVVQIKNHDCP